MKRFSTIFAPGLVLFSAVLTGGWFLQKGVSQEKNVYFQLRLFEEVVDHVMSSYVDPVDRGEIYQSAIDGILGDLGDPNTSFMAASDADDFRIRMEGEYGGVGLEVIERDGWVTVVTPLPGTPGTRAGIRAGDQIVVVDGQPTDDWDPDEVVNQLRGRPGTDVSVMIRRPGLEDPIPFTITRATIQLKSVPFALELQDGVGYVPLLSVTEMSFEEVRRAVDSLESEGIRQLILDLRGNPGGTLDQGIAITDYFLDPGKGVVETRGREMSQNETFTSTRQQPYPDLALVVLVDERSASAAEIIAGALQDHDRAVVLGAPTWGKGSVQTLYPLTGGNILRLTTARWYTPVGRSINKKREDQIATLERSALTLAGFLAALPDTVAKPAYLTDGGRKVLGGGGIVPDVLVMADTLTTAEMEAVRELDRSGGSFQTAVFNFAVLYLQAHPSPPRDFSVGPQDLEDFQALLTESGVSLSPSAFGRLERFIRFQLEREIALRTWGEVGEFLRMLNSDRVVQRALDLLEDSETTADLLRMASQVERSDWIPVVATETPQESERTDTGGEGTPQGL
ncbi:MAG: S41 family peptidase [Longimicrobiales bacterium]